MPSISIFHRHPYDIVYEHQGFIRGYRNQDASRIKIKQIYKMFKEAGNQRELPKNQPAVAAFANQQMLILSDSDLYLATYKPKSDHQLFKKLLYIRNKLPTNNSIPILCPFNHKEQDLPLLKLATAGLMGFHSEQYIRERLLRDSQQRYLQYQNQKIVLTMNYQHNIRIMKCMFVYIKTNDNRYFLTNIKNLSFVNLTRAIIDREHRLALKQQQRNKILIMTPQKQLRYKSLQNNKFVKIYEQVMNTQFNSMLKKMNLYSIQDSEKESLKNQLAFKKLHPLSKYTLAQLLTSNNFIKIKDQALEKSNRKPITIPSRYVMRYYNKIKNSRMNTDGIRTISTF